MSNKKSFLLHHDSLEIFEMLTDEETGKLFKAMIAFNVSGELMELDRQLNLLFVGFKNQFIRETEKWENASKKKSEAKKEEWKKRQVEPQGIDYNVIEPPYRAMIKKYVQHREKGGSPINKDEILGFVKDLKDMGSLPEAEKYIRKICSPK